MTHSRLSDDGFVLPMMLIICLFFLWGVANNLNDVLIPHFKKRVPIVRATFRSESARLLPALRAMETFTFMSIKFPTIFAHAIRNWVNLPSPLHRYS